MQGLCRKCGKCRWRNRKKTQVIHYRTAQNYTTAKIFLNFHLIFCCGWEHGIRDLDRILALRAVWASVCQPMELITLSFREVRDLTDQEYFRMTLLFFSIIFNVPIVFCHRNMLQIIYNILLTDQLVVLHIYYYNT